MEVIYNNANKMTVFLDGRSIPCDSDLDCPGDALCAKHAHFAAQPAMCICPIAYGRAGATCQELSDMGYALFAMLLVAMFLAAVIVVLAAYDIFLMRRAGLKWAWTSTQSTLVLLMADGAWLLLTVLLLIGETFGSMSPVSRKNGSNKAHSFYAFTNFSTAVAMILGQLTLLNVCLVWLEVTNVRARFTGNIRLFKGPLIVITLIYILVYLFLVGFDLTLQIAYASIPGFAFIIFLFGIGFFRLQAYANRKRRNSDGQLLRSVSVSDNPAFESDTAFGLLEFNLETKPGSSNRLLRERRKDENVKKKLRNIANISMAIAVFGSTCILMLLVTAGLGGSADTPLAPVSGFLLRTALICFLACLMIVAVYAHQQTCVSVGKRSNLFVPNPANASASSRFSSSRSVRLKKKQSASSLIRDKDNRTGMSEILKRENAELRLRFTEFVRSKYADEPLMFYDACTKYNELAQQSRERLKGKNVRLITLGHQIVNNFIRDNSLKWVNVSDEVRRELLHAAETDAFDEDTFEKAKNAALELLKQNFYLQFVKMLEEEEDAEVEDNNQEELNSAIKVRDAQDLNL